MRCQLSWALKDEQDFVKRKNTVLPAIHQALTAPFVGFLFYFQVSIFFIISFFFFSYLDFSTESAREPGMHLGLSRK